MIILPGLWSTLHTRGHFLIEDCWLLFRDLESINGLSFYNWLMLFNVGIQNYITLFLAYLSSYLWLHLWVIRSWILLRFLRCYIGRFDSRWHLCLF